MGLQPAGVGGLTYEPAWDAAEGGGHDDERNVEAEVEPGGSSGGCDAAEGQAEQM